MRVMLCMGSDLGFFSVVWGILILAFSSALLGAGIRDGIRDYQELNASATDTFEEQLYRTASNACASPMGVATSMGGTASSAATGASGSEAPMTSWAGWYGPPAANNRLFRARSCYRLNIDLVQGRALTIRNTYVDTKCAGGFCGRTFNRWGMNTWII